ncbi:iron transporter substrate-binding protein [Aureimonas endophytica]|uniref:Iron transporter substrate-binding protein n=1 Tax=Aureimonas endophytica TaxID=2027858 RepID=A0A917E420_9HYPH|nr:iron uptake system protein EfeO [Aureimonas endophytica]GGE00944.1 iron transporter substrate-binding protein [Aureimonas endophytica]
MSSPDRNGAAGRGPGRFMGLAVAGAALLMLAGGGAFYFASLKAGAAKGDGQGAVTVTLRDGACQPNALTVPAGRAEFRIVNATDRAVEWEILDGVMVVEERENIAPGLTQAMGAKLKPGTYAITCGLLSNPRGTLTVTPSAAAPDAARPDLVAFIGPLAEYQVYLAREAGNFAKGAAALGEAIKAGDAERAKALYPEARAPFLHLAPVATRFADLENAIDPVAAYFEKREADAGFTGFHHIEYGLFGTGDLTGLDTVSAKLITDAAALKDRLRATKLAPSDMFDGAVRVLATLAETRIPAGEALYAKTDLADFEAELAGVAKIVALLKPVAAENAPAKFGEVETRLAALQTEVAGLRGAAGFPAYDTIDTGRRTALAEKARALADALTALGEAVSSDEAKAS